MRACGLDFGTSNSAIGVIAGNAPALAPMEGGRPLLPTAVFFDFAERNRVLFGREAIEASVAGEPGRLMRALKSILSTPLVHESTNVKWRRVRFTEVIGAFVRRMKTQAEAHADGPLEAVVHGRPVHFVDGDPLGDAFAEDRLREIAGGAGFAEVSFAFEPIAAALAYEAGLAREELVLVADIGGGTSDFTLARLSPARAQAADRSGDILGSTGVRVGGTDLDRQASLAAVMPLLGQGGAVHTKNLPLPSLLFQDLATWSRINFLYDPATLREVRALHEDAQEPEKTARLLKVVRDHLGHRIAFAVEAARIALSEGESADVRLDMVEPGLRAPLARAAFEAAAARETARVRACAAECLRQAGVAPERVDTIFLTGGASRTPALRAAIAAAAPSARLASGDDFLSVAQGLTILAQRRYGAARMI